MKRLIRGNQIEFQEISYNVEMKQLLVIRVTILAIMNLNRQVKNPVVDHLINMFHLENTDGYCEHPGNESKCTQNNGMI